MAATTCTAHLLTPLSLASPLHTTEDPLRSLVRWLQGLSLGLDALKAPPQLERQPAVGRPPKHTKAHRLEAGVAHYRDRVHR